MELFLNGKEILFIKSLRIKKYIALWKNRTYLLVFRNPLIVCFLEIHPFCLAQNILAHSTDGYRM